MSTVTLNPSVAHENEEDFANTQNTLVSIVSDIKQIMGSVSMSELDDVDNNLRSFSFLDLIEALTTTEMVVRDRLKVETIKLEKGRDVVTPVVEFGGDVNKTNNLLYISIGEQIKETLRDIFSVPSSNDSDMDQNHKSDRKVSTFLYHYNQLVVDKLMKALREYGPNKSLAVIGAVIEIAKQAVIDQEAVLNRETPNAAKNILAKYQNERASKIKQKTAGQKRLTAIRSVIRDMEQNVNTDNDEDEIDLKFLNQIEDMI